MGTDWKTVATAGAPLLGPGLTIGTGGEIEVKVASGIKFDGLGNVVFQTGNGLTIDGSGNVHINNGAGLTVDVTGVYVGAGQIDDSKISTLSAGKISAGTFVGGVVYAGVVAATQVAAGTLAAGVIYTGDISASQITTGTLAVDVSLNGAPGYTAAITSGSISLTGSGGSIDLDCTTSGATITMSSSVCSITVGSQASIGPYSSTFFTAVTFSGAANMNGGMGGTHAQNLGTGDSPTFAAVTASSFAVPGYTFVTSGGDGSFNALAITGGAFTYHGVAVTLQTVGGVANVMVA